MKNTGAIRKIISELARKDWQEQYNRNKHKPIHLRRVKHLTLSPETLEAVDIQQAYLSDEISEAEYKQWCMRYHLREVTA